MKTLAPIPKKGFLTGAAADAMLLNMERRFEEVVFQHGYRKQESGWRREPKIAVPNTGVFIDPGSIPAILTQPGVGIFQDRQTGLIWDTVTVAVATAFPTLTTMFTLPQSGTKPLSATNLHDTGKLQYPERMDVTKLRLFVLNNIALPDLLALYTNVTFTVQVNGSFTKFEGLPWMMPAGGGAHITGGNQVGTAPAGSSVYHSTGNGVPDIRNVLELPDIIQLGAGENFNTQVQNWTPFNTSANTTNPPGTGITFVVAFQGDRFKPFGG